VLCAGEPDSAAVSGNLLLWSGGGAAAGARSIVEYLEVHAEEIRHRYLAWVHDLGNLRVEGLRIRDRMPFADGARMWRYSLFAEQNPWKQSSLQPLLKLFALERILDREVPRSFELLGGDAALDAMLAAICHQRGIRYEWRRMPAARRRSGWRETFFALPHGLQGAFALLRLWLRSLALGAPRGALAPDGAPRALFCGPLINHRTGGAFESAFWAGLPQVLQEAGYRLHWLHYYYRHDRVRDPRAARRALKLANETAERSGTHDCVDAHFSFLGLCRVARDWIRITRDSKRIARELRGRFEAQPDTTCWPLLEEDWGRAFRGIGCVENLVYVECFDRAMKALQRQDEGLFLLENQSWERALARAWHRHSHGRLTGVAHSTVRFWDLRYHSDPRADAEASEMPDAVALNGPVARQSYLSTAEARGETVECEALRYLHLRAASQRAVGAVHTRTALRILVLGDYTPQGTRAVIESLQAALLEIAFPVEVCVKCHPNFRIEPAAYPQLSLRLREEPVGELAADADVVLGSNTTSASVDAYASGARVLVFDDRSGLNFSPLRGVAGVRFIHDAAELRRALYELRAGSEGDASPARPFFHLDPSLPRWRRYLRLADGSAH
jgi:surface carbohydrate biosynthesis protein (TIGR04326 family)